MIPQHHSSLASSRRAFTLIEVIVSVLIIFVLMGLLLGGLAITNKYAKSAAERQAVQAIKVGVSQFKQDYGFLPPLVRDEAAAGARATIETDSANENVIAVYRAGTTVPYVYDTAMRVPNVPPAADNPLSDHRYSNRSLAIYLAGGIDASISGTVTASIDGIAGPGFYKPRQNGSFEVPPDIRKPNAQSKRTTGASESLIDLGKRTPKLFVNGQPIYPNEINQVELRDSNGVPIRYYRWLPGDPTQNFRVQTPADLNIPAMVGRDGLNAINAILKPDPARDITQNAAIRSATFAIVAAGPNQVFGDEPAAELVLKMGGGDPADAALVASLRSKAEADNIVEVGQ